MTDNKGAHYESDDDEMDLYISQQEEPTATAPTATEPTANVIRPEGISTILASNLGHLSVDLSQLGNHALTQFDPSSV